MIRTDTGLVGINLGNNQTLPATMQVPVDSFVLGYAYSALQQLQV